MNKAQSDVGKLEALMFLMGLKSSHGYCACDSCDKMRLCRFSICFLFHCLAMLYGPEVCSSGRMPSADSIRAMRMLFKISQIILLHLLVLPRQAVGHLSCDLEAWHSKIFFKLYTQISVEIKVLANSEFACILFASGIPSLHGTSEVCLASGN